MRHKPLEVESGAANAGEAMESLLARLRMLIEAVETDRREDRLRRIEARVERGIVPPAMRAG